MCGIVGLVAFEAPLEECRRHVERMAERIRHRGPDGGGVIANEGATLGMTRLAIVDVEHGHQPMANDDGSIVIVYNGEVYNAPELRKRLQQSGVRFQTRSDTEVILRLYEKDPDFVEEQLVGMWAFAIHDRRRKKVILSRDRFGIKPLFVADSGGALAFASELRCFDRTLSPFAHCFALDHGAAHAMVSFSFVPESATIWSGVQRLSPATRLEIDLPSRRRTSRTYWTLVPSSDAARVTNMEEACRNVETLLRRAVREHLESDVPIATFLSGGIDSSLVTAYALEASTRPVHAYTIGFTEPHFDESPFARSTAEKLSVPIEVEMFDEAKARARVVDALLAYDEPFGDSSSLPTYLLSQHVARNYKVALGGDGGDEVFAGYGKYLVTRLRQPLARVPSVRDRAGRFLGALHTRAERFKAPPSVALTLRRLSRGLTGPDDEVYARLTQVAPLAQTAALLRNPMGAERFLDAARERFQAARGTELQRTLACELANTLTNDMLVKVDRASMANRLEARVPFLDHRIAEYGVGLPSRFLLGDGRGSGKAVLRKLHEQRFGRELSTRKKWGFGIPIKKWLTGPFDAACDRLFDARRLDRFGILSSDALSNGRFREWVATEPYVVWHAFALAAWCEATLGDGPDALKEFFETQRTQRTDRAPDLARNPEKLETLRSQG